MKAPRKSRKEVREAQQLVLSIGYEYVGDGSGHTRYVMDGQVPIVLPNTPSDPRWLDNFKANLRRRHPDHELLGRAEKNTEARAARKKSPRKRATPTAETGPVVVPAEANPRKTGPLRARRQPRQPWEVRPARANEQDAA